MSPTFRLAKVAAPLAAALALFAVHAQAQQTPVAPSGPPAAQQPPQPGAQPPDQTTERGREARPGLSPEDRTAFFNARIAALKAGLMLTPDQEKLWPAAEAAGRDLLRQRMEMRERMRSAERPANGLEGMKALGEAQVARGQALKTFADAAIPLYASLNDDQKRRLRVLARPMGMPMGMERGMMDRRGMDDRRDWRNGPDRDDRGGRQGWRGEDGDRQQGRDWRGQDRRDPREDRYGRSDQRGDWRRDRDDNSRPDFYHRQGWNDGAGPDHSNGTGSRVDDLHDDL